MRNSAGVLPTLEINTIFLEISNFIYVLKFNYYYRNFWLDPTYWAVREVSVNCYVVDNDAQPNLT